MRQLFTGMHDSSHCLHRLLLENSAESAIHTLHNHRNYRVLFARTNRFKNSFSFLLYALQNCQSVLLNICNLYSILTFYWMYRPTCISLSFYPAAGCEINKMRLIDYQRAEFVVLSSLPLRRPHEEWPSTGTERHWHGHHASRRRRHACQVTQVRHSLLSCSSLLLTPESEWQISLIIC